MSRDVRAAGSPERAQRLSTYRDRSGGCSQGQSMTLRTLVVRRVAALLTLVGLILAIALGSPSTALGAPALARVPGVED